MTISLLLFYGVAGLLVLSALMVVMARHAVHSVLFLILCFFNAAILFIFLGAELLAFILMIVYVGAVAVLFLFVVMMLDKQQEDQTQRVSRAFPVAGFVGVALLCELGMLFFHWRIQGSEGENLGKDLLSSEAISNSEAIGLVLYTKYAFLLEMSGLILLVAMIGAIVLTLRKEGRGGRGSPLGKQLSRRREDVIEIKKMPVSEKLS